MIPVAAHNAAFLVLASRYPNSELVYSEDFIRAMDEALEAAAPHMLAQILELADEMDNVHGSIRGHVTTYQLRKALGVNDE